MELENVITLIQYFSDPVKQDFSSYLRLFNEIADSAELSPQIKLVVLKSKLRDQPFKIFEQNVDWQLEKNYTTFCKLLEQKFVKKLDFGEAKDIFLGTRQTDNQSVQNFYETVSKQAATFLEVSGLEKTPGAKQLTDLMLLTQFVRGLKPELQFEVDKISPDKLTDALKIAKNAERAYKNYKARENKDRDKSHFLAQISNENNGMKQNSAPPTVNVNHLRLTPQFGENQPELPKKKNRRKRYRVAPMPKPQWEENWAPEYHPNFNQEFQPQYNWEQNYPYMNYDNYGVGNYNINGNGTRYSNQNMQFPNDNVWYDSVNDFYEPVYDNDEIYRVVSEQNKQGVNAQFKNKRNPRKFNKKFKAKESKNRENSSNQKEFENVQTQKKQRRKVIVKNNNRQNSNRDLNEDDSENNYENFDNSEIISNSNNSSENERIVENNGNSDFQNRTQNKKRKIKKVHTLQLSHNNEQNSASKNSKEKKKVQSNSIPPCPLIEPECLKEKEDCQDNQSSDLLTYDQCARYFRNFSEFKYPVNETV